MRTKTYPVNVPAAAAFADREPTPAGAPRRERPPSIYPLETYAQCCASTVQGVDVVLIRWPAEAVRRAQLAVRQMPRLLLLEDNAIPPQPMDCLEDWIRVPAAEIDVRSRCSALAARAEQHVSAAPSLDDDGVLRFSGMWVPLPPVEARLTEALLQRFGAVVSRESLGRAGWVEGAPGRNALDVHVLRLRRRIQPLGLAIRTVRSRGYLLEEVPSAMMHRTAVEA
jgi:two-component system OmpR family response regulator